MDKKIAKKKWTNKKIASIALGVFFIGFLLYYFLLRENKSTLKIDPAKVAFSNVERGDFQEYIIQLGEVIPGRTYYLDAVEGGNITKIFKESGADVKKGDKIVELENINLRLSVLSQENSLNEQINRIRTTRLQLDQNFLTKKQELAQIENQLQILKPQYKRDSILYKKQLISKQVYERTEADYKYNVKRKIFTLKAFESDSTARVLQLKQLRSSEASMLENLEGVRQILDNLIIKAPIDGQLSSPQLQEGQNINKGERIGQVDISGVYKVRVPVDELYLSKIKKGLRATTEIANKTYELQITYVYPNITNGRFDVDMQFMEAIPESIRRGQSLRLKIELGNPSIATLIPVGGFYQSTGGNWIFVEDGTNKAIKRPIRLGRRNTAHYEVIDGLNPGERVIISSYSTFGENEELVW
ncbi:HlyD family efflux transporter periplasmic adaptor subunit [Kordia algicida OT-1]|uniref:ABC transporter permease n=1 Tax=Kordia algicida OT-1 TaxID=391587 RepID=A9E3H6_9FLAO|nr:HlyD family efflux transporter periplasmic adaptor subunit [Kordia algicida]EDP95511.1 ABC transporter permease [Kordia algicida OT-1]